MPNSGLLGSSFFSLIVTIVVIVSPIKTGLGNLNLSNPYVNAL